MNSRIITSDYEQLSGQPADVVRNAIRQGLYSGHTAGLAQGYLQCNLVILAADLASDFEHFCALNSKACPLVSVSSAGQTGFNDLGAHIDLRTDLPLYNIYRSGKLDAQRIDISDLWQPDFIAFAIGCSFTFERALMDAGIPMRHVDLDLTVPMFKTNMATRSAGVFGGETVMSMRPVKRNQIQQVIDICSLYPHAHGEPMHIGNPEAIGIADLNSPDWGNSVPLYGDETPVFWGCGVTSQAAVLKAAPELCITHAPGAMLITESNERPASK